MILSTSKIKAFIAFIFLTLNSLSSVSYASTAINDSSCAAERGGITYNCSAGEFESLVSLAAPGAPPTCLSGTNITIDVVVARKNIEIVLEDCSYREFEKKCLLALNSEFVTVGTPEDPDDVSPLQRLNIGQAAVITRKQDEVQLAAILEIYRRTVEKTTGDIEKQMVEAKPTRMTKINSPLPYATPAYTSSSTKW